MSKIRYITKSIAITILIGGKSTRFGSDKGLFELFEKPLISYQLETLSQLNYDIFIIAHSMKQVQEYMEKIDITKINAFIIDEIDTKIRKTLHTPMIGLYSAFKELKKLRYEKVLVLSCDTPLLKKEVLNYLIEECKNFDCCIPQWTNGFLEPLIAIYPVKKALRTSKSNLKKKSYKLTNLLSTQWKTKFISIEKEIKTIDENLLTFININEPSDLENLKERYFNKKKENFKKN
ncbi:MAG: molybdenum cofactor guanylyltransferase [Candidatus Lokiarchaeota archaeon]|nr:molybdenum cofactor guanylyltransferase [Candidatus Lokiarchaeota archaeon]